MKTIDIDEAIEAMKVNAKTAKKLEMTLDEFLMGIKTDVMRLAAKIGWHHD